MAESKKKADIKVVIVGDACVGKTTFIRRYIEGTFTENAETVGACFFLKQWGSHNIAIWDTAGEERFSGLNSFYCRDASAAIVAYDITTPESFERLQEHYIPLLESAKEDCLLCLTGMKMDLVDKTKREKTVSSAEAEEYSLRLNANRFRNKQNFKTPFFETSSITGESVENVFEYIFATLLSSEQPVSSQGNITLGETRAQNEKKPCC